MLRRLKKSMSNNLILSFSESFLKNINTPSLSSQKEIVIQNSSLSGNDFLLGEPVGCYTGARTINRFYVIEYENHLNRLLHGASKKVFTDNNSLVESEQVRNLMKPLRDSQILYPLINELCSKGLQQYFLEIHNETKTDTGIYDTCDTNNFDSKNNTIPSKEAKLNFLLGYNFEKQAPVLKLHISPLKTPSNSTCEINFFGTPRSNPDIKDSQWVRDRSSIEKVMSKGIEEVLLLDSDTGNIYEGLSSNFFAIVDASICDSGKPEIWTASPELVLKGTIMTMVFDCCKDLNIPICTKLPNIHDAYKGLWNAAFITSTSRLILPVSKIHPLKSDLIQKSKTTSDSIELSSPLSHPYIQTLVEYVQKRINSKAQLLVK